MGQKVCFCVAIFSPLSRRDMGTGGVMKPPLLLPHVGPHMANLVQPFPISSCLLR